MLTSNTYRARVARWSFTLAMIFTWAGGFEFVAVYGAPAGEAEDAKEDKEAQAMHSTKTRAQRKAETRADAKAGKLIPAGEGPGATTK